MGLFSGLFDDLLPAIGAIAGVALAPTTGGASLALEGAAIGGAVGGAAKGVLTGGNILEDAAIGGVMGGVGEEASSLLTGAGAAADAAGGATTTSSVITNNSFAQITGENSAQVGAGALSLNSSTAAVTGGDLSVNAGSNTIGNAVGANSLNTITNNAVAANATASASSGGGIFSDLSSGNISGAASDVVNDVKGASASTDLAAGGLVLNAGMDIYNAGQAKKATDSIGAAPEAPINSAADQLTTYEQDDELNQRRGLASNILTSPTGRSRNGMSASQMLLS